MIQPLFIFTKEVDDMADLTASSAITQNTQSHHPQHTSNACIYTSELPLQCFLFPRLILARLSSESLHGWDTVGELYYNNLLLLGNLKNKQTIQTLYKRNQRATSILF